MTLFEQYIDTHFVLWHGALLVRYAYVDRPGRCAALCRWAYWRGLRFEWVHDGGYGLIDWAAAGDLRYNNRELRRRHWRDS